MSNCIELAIDMIKYSKQKSSALKFPCSICYKVVLANQRAIQCDACSLWCHIKCDGTNLESYKNIMDNMEITWKCLVCKIKFQHENIPFTLYDDTELLNISNSESMKFCDQLPSLQTILEGSKFDELECNEVDHNLPNRLINKYYSVGEVHKLNTSKNFNIFHSNVNGLVSIMDLLHEVLSSTSDFDVIAISETSHRNNDFF